VASSFLTRPGWCYQPSYVVRNDCLLGSLFVRPKHGHYYYGDYYDRRYEERGFYPWHSKQVMRYGDDPIYTHYRSRQLRDDMFCKFLKQAKTREDIQHLLEEADNHQFSA
jgi:hypothetical protein